MQLHRVRKRLSWARDAPRLPLPLTANMATLSPQTANMTTHFPQPSKTIVIPRFILQLDHFEGGALSIANGSLKHCIQF